MSIDDSTLPPRQIIEEYRRAYLAANDCEPNARYMGNHWYFVNGETVHRTTLVGETVRLREFAHRKRMIATDKNIIHRLIAKLRSL